MSRKSQATGIREDGLANRALSRAYKKGKPWAVVAVSQAAVNLRTVWMACGLLLDGNPEHDEKKGPV